MLNSRPGCEILDLQLFIAFGRSRECILGFLRCVCVYFFHSLCSVNLWPSQTMDSVSENGWGPLPVQGTVQI